MLNRLNVGVQAHLRDQADLVSGSFEVVASRLSRLSTAAQARGEHVSEVSEGPVVSGTATYTVGGGQFANVSCHYCGFKGHIARFCPKKRSER